MFPLSFKAISLFSDNQVKFADEDSSSLLYLFFHLKGAGSENGKSRVVHYDSGSALFELCPL
ncbi:MAG TPA: hypothetical protein PKH78_12930, partial [Candidatus Obscuribacter sp.]|nr:hypothetical protein [Candidatus Obscuribacter sp.]